MQQYKHSLSKQPARINNLNLKSLDALRGFLAVYVVAGHCRWLLWTGYTSWSQLSHPLWQTPLALFSSLLRYGHEAVIVFFVLSGLFIHLRVSQQLAESNPVRFDLPKFFRRRGHRLIPPYVFSLALTIGFDAIGMLLYPTLYQANTGNALIDMNFANAGYSLKFIIPALLLLPNSSGYSFGSNGPFWSLSYEIVYYAIYPLWLLLRRRGALLAYSSGLCIAVISSVFLPNHFIGSVLSHYPLWLCGAALAEILTSKKSRLVAKLNSLWLLALVSLMLAFVGIHFSGTSNLKLLPYALLGTSLVFLMTRLPIHFYRFPIHKFFEYLGLRSYTIYICHFPIVSLISAWVIENKGGRPNGGWVAMSGFFISLLICNLCFYLCENHFLHPRIKLDT